MDGSSSRVTDESLQGLKYLKRVFGAFEQLKEAGTERDRAGNRTLLYSQYAGLVLLSMFNPAMQSVRGLSDASALKRVQKLLGGGRVSIGSLSESTGVFDPKLLEGIVEHLLKELPQSVSGAGPRRSLPTSIPHELAEKLLAVDGSSFRILPQIVNAFSSPAQGKWKLHLQFRVLRGTPHQTTVTADETGGADDERSVLAEHLEAGHVYLADRGYERYALLEKIVQTGSDYIVRCQRRPVDVLEVRDVSLAAREARVLSDEIVQLGKSRLETGAVTHRVRRIVIQSRGQGGKKQNHSDVKEIVLLTSLVDVPAEVIAATYSLRWVIELFFRWLKHLLGCQHLLSTKSNGITIQIYCALIASLLLAQVTGRNVGRRAFNLICLSLQGWADNEELIAGLERIAKSESSRKQR